MAKNQQPSDAPEATTTSEAEGYSAERLARMAKGAMVTVFDLEKDGQVKVDPKTKQKLVVTRPITAADIFSHAVRGDRVVIVTIDGQKLDVAA